MYSISNYFFLNFKFFFVKLNVLNFKHLLDINQTDLSTDQEYLYDIHKSVSAGKLSEGLAGKNPEKMAHSWCLTTANRILRLYVSTDEPFQILKIIVEYIMKVYAPVWFAIKKLYLLKMGLCIYLRQ